MGLPSRLLLMAAVATVATAQFSSVTVECGNNTLGADGRVPATLLGESLMYFTFRASALMSFEYRMVALDRKPLGWKEAYDYDEGSDDSANFECFVSNTTDDTTCPNAYLANGQTLLIYDRVNVNFGFQKCDGYNPAVHSQQVTLKVYARPIDKDVIPPGMANMCEGLAPVVPLPSQMCTAQARAAAAGFAGAVRVAAALAAVVALLAL